jgi:hypothetical protein
VSKRHSCFALAHIRDDGSGSAYNLLRFHKDPKLGGRLRQVCAVCCALCACSLVLSRCPHVSMSLAHARRHHALTPPLF